MQGDAGVDIRPVYRDFAHSYIGSTSDFGSEGRGSTPRWATNSKYSGKCGKAVNEASFSAVQQSAIVQ